MSFTEVEIEYLNSQRLGRLASVSPTGAPQNNPVAFRYNPETGTIDIGGHNLTASRKFCNIQVEPRVAFVVDDLASTNPWRARGVEIRGRAEALTDVEPPHPYFDSAMIRIRPTRIITWGIDGAPMSGRNVES
ncbi:PPOX class F420-dependent oxidoreductase [Micromonospora sp. NPDC004540]|uniref:PPOX class F420-dependent oxidoreductase n=1 Tax=Micromonospora sp. NPDC004540 TaxID=3154457 RepID=UPI0033AF9589